MPRATRVVSRAHRHDGAVVDTVILNYGQRSAQKVTVTGVKVGTIEIDLPAPARLRTDDLLVLEDGTLVEVVAAPEPLIEARATDVWRGSPGILATAMCRLRCCRTESVRAAIKPSKICSRRSARKWR
jgi:urease accessory protein UreE